MKKLLKMLLSISISIGMGEAAVSCGTNPEEQKHESVKANPTDSTSINEDNKDAPTSINEEPNKTINDEPLVGDSSKANEDSKANDDSISSSNLEDPAIEQNGGSTSKGGPSTYSDWSDRISGLAEPDPQWVNAHQKNGKLDVVGVINDINNSVLGDEYPSGKSSLVKSDQSEFSITINKTTFGEILNYLVNEVYFSVRNYIIVTLAEENSNENEAIGLDTDEVDSGTIDSEYVYFNYIDITDPTNIYHNHLMFIDCYSQS